MCLASSNSNMFCTNKKATDLLGSLPHKPNLPEGISNKWIHQLKRCLFSFLLHPILLLSFILKSLSQFKKITAWTSPTHHVIALKKKNCPVTRKSPFLKKVFLLPKWLFQAKGKRTGGTGIVGEFPFCLQLKLSQYHSWQAEGKGSLCSRGVSSTH